MNTKTILLAGLAAIVFASCQKDDKDPAPVQKIPYTSLTATTNYFTTFQGPDSLSSVDFSGQTTRISMMKEMDAYMKTGINASIQASKLNDMFNNQNSAFNSANLNAATDKTIVSKTAQSFGGSQAETERQRFRGWFDSLEMASINHGQQAQQGMAGVLDGKYLVDAKGFEYGQFIQKGLIGAMMLDQISNIYLGAEKQNADNSTIITDKNYTALEHHWDEAYGYLTSNEFFPKTDPNDNTKYLESYLGGYVRQVKAPYGNPADVYMSFLKGRAAIVNNDMSTRDEQISSIRAALEKSIAVIAVSYLNKAKTASTDGGRFHALSEGVGFIYALRFAHNAKIDREKSNELLDNLLTKPNGFWSLTPGDLDAVRNVVADAFSIERNAVVNH